MTSWTKPAYSRSDVNLAGRFLANQTLPNRRWAASDDGEWVDVGRAYEIIDNWRAAHSGPMTTVYPNYFLDSEFFVDLVHDAIE